jgi:hypothetical protein
LPGRRRRRLLPRLTCLRRRSRMSSLRCEKCIPKPRFRNAGTFLKVRVPEFVVAFTFSILAFDFWNYDDRSS